MNKAKHNGKYNEGKIFTKDDLRNMTVVRQLDYVKYYFQMNIAAGKQIKNALDLYMCIFCPNAVGQSDSFICYKEGGSAYKGNASIDGETYDETKHKRVSYSNYTRDANKNIIRGEKGYITKGDLWPRYKDKKWRGELLTNMNISKCIYEKDDDKKIKDGNISKYLTYNEAIFSSTANDKNIDNTPTDQYIENLKELGTNIYDKVYEHFGGKVKLTSVYRCKELNKAIGGSSTSQHLLGEAMDIKGITPITNKDIFKYIVDNLEYYQIIWEFGNTNNPSWVHVGYRQGNNKKVKTISTKDSSHKTVYSTFNIKLD